MSYVGAIAVLHAHLVTAGATLSPKITSSRVRAGEPYAVVEPTIAYWYLGDAESKTGGNTMGGVTNIDEMVLIRCYWWIANRDDAIASRLEASVQAANRAIQAEISPDRDLGSNCLEMFIEATTAGYLQQGPDGWLRVLSIPLRIGFAAAETISL